MSEKIEKVKKIRPFGWADKIGYAFGDFGNDFSFMLSSLFMMKFYTDVMGIEAAVVGLLMMIARFVDAFTDVMMGQLVDRSKPTKAGKFKPWIKRMCGPVAVASFLIYQSAFANFDYGFKVVWMFITYLLWGSIFYTSINIPYGSMASAISEKPEHRTQLSAFRTFGGQLAHLTIGVATPLFAYEVVNGATILSGSKMTIIAGLFSLGAIICYILCYNLVRERVNVPQNTKKFSIKEFLTSIGTNRPLIGIIVAALMLLLSTLTMSGFAPYIFPVYYGSAEGQSLTNFYGALSVIIICAPLGTFLANKFGKKEVATVASILAALTFVICLIVHPENVYVYVIFWVLAWMFVQTFGTLAWAMITDVIDHAEIKNGIREDGTIYAVYSFARKLGQAFSAGLVGSVLSAIGYTAAVAKNPAAYPDVLTQMFDWSCVLPIIIFVILAIALIFIYPLSKKKVAENTAKLQEKHKEEANK